MSNSVEPVNIDFVLKNVNFKAEAEKMKAEIRGVTSTAQKEASEMSKAFKGAVGSVGAIVSVSLLANFAKEISNVRGEWQKYEAVLTNTLESNQDAKDSLDMIAKYGAKTNFQVNELTDSFVKLASQGFKPTKDEIASLGDLAASKAKGFGQLSEAIIDAETFEFERLKEFGIRAAKNGDQIQFTFKGIKTTVDASAESVRNYILSLGQMEGVKGSTDAIAKTIVGLTSNFSDAVNQMMNSLGKDQEGLIAGSIQTATDLVNNYEKVADAIKMLVVTYGAYKAASIALSVIETYRAEMMVTQTVKGMYTAVTVTQQLTFAQWASAKAQGAVNAAMAINPYVAAATAIGLLISALVIYGDTADEAAEAQKKVNDTVNEQKAKIETLVTIIKSETTANAERAKAIKELNDILPASVGFIDAQTLSTQKGKDAIDEYIKSIRKKAEIESLTNQLNKNISDQDKVSSGDMSGQLNFVQRIAYAGLTPEEKDADQARAMYNLKEQEAQIKKNIEAVVSGGKDEESTNKVLLTVNQQLLDNRKDLTAAELKLKQLRLPTSTATPDEIKKQSDLVERLKEQQTILTGTKVEKEKAAKKEKEDIKSIIEVSEEYLDIQQKISDKVKELREAKTADDGILINSEIRQLEKQLAGLSSGTTIKPIVQAQLTGTGKSTTAEQLKPMKQLTDEQKKQLEAKSKQLGLDEVARENLEKEAELRYEIIGCALDLVDALTRGMDLTQAQSEALSGVMNMANSIGRGDYIGAGISAITTAVGAIMDTSGIEDKLAAPWIEFENWVSRSNDVLERYIKLRDEAIGSERYSSSDNAIQEAKDFQAEAEAKLNAMKLSWTFTSSGWFDNQTDEVMQKYIDKQKEIGQGFLDIEGNIKTSSIFGYDTAKLVASYDLSQLTKDENGDFSLTKLQQLIDDGIVTDQAVIDGVKAYNANADKLIQLQKEKQELLTNALGSNIADSIIDGFKNGYSSAADFADNFEGLMRDAVLNAVKIKYLEQPMQDWYAQFALDMESGGGLDQLEKEKLNTRWNEIIDIGKSASDAALSAAGVSLSPAKSSAMTGISASASEDTVAAMVGQLMAVRVDIKSILVSIAAGSDDVAKNLLYMKEIAENTKPIYRLKAIEEGIAEINTTLKNRL